MHLTLNFTFSGQFGSLITLRHVLRWSWSFQKLMKVRRTSDFSVFQVWKFSFQDQEFINCKNCPCRTFFSIFDVRYFFNTTTVTYRNPVKHNWNSTRKTKKKNCVFLSYYSLKSKKLENLLFLGVLWGTGNQHGIQCFFTILWIYESLSLYLLVKNSFNFKLGVFTYFKYISVGIIRKDILRSDYRSARWY